MQRFYLSFYFLFVCKIWFIFGNEDEPPFIIRTLASKDPHIQEIMDSLNHYFGSREAIDDVDDPRLIQSAEEVALYLLNDEKPRLLVMISPFDDINKEMQPTSLEGFGKKITCANSNSPNLNDPTAILRNNDSVEHMEKILTFLNSFFEEDIVHSCRYLSVSNLFILDINSDHSLVDVRMYIHQIWKTNEQIWLLEPDSKLSFRELDSIVMPEDSKGISNINESDKGDDVFPPSRELNDDNYETMPSFGSSFYIPPYLYPSVPPPPPQNNNWQYLSLVPPFMKYVVNPLITELFRGFPFMREEDESVSDPLRGLLSNFFNINFINNPKNPPPDYAPNDQYFSRQWGLKNQAHEGIDTHAIGAWNVYHNIPNKKSTIVAHIDTGIDLNHPDLQGRLWVNEGEIPGDNIDNDGNGYVDDVHGWNFVHNNNDLRDTNGHGTHTAGILAASINNEKGIAGLAVDIKLMPLKILNKASEAVEAIEYSLDKGIQISSNSWGFVAPIKSLKVAMAKTASFGQLFICAVDNRSQDNTYFKDYPANWGPGLNNHDPFNNILRVASIDSTGHLSSTSNYGKYNVDIAAPGKDILSTVPYERYGGNYAYKSGTSMATPFVAATAAMMSSIYSLSALEIRSLILETSKHLEELNNLIVTEGILNTEAAIKAVLALRNKHGFKELQS